MTATIEPLTTLDTMVCNDETRWEAIQRRDRSKDGIFVFAVATTGIYCRPSCPARRPRQENVRYFADPTSAERAGFRACRRCQPRNVLSPQEELITRATAWIEEHLDERITLPRLAGALGVSVGHLQRTFTRQMWVSPRAYAAALRLERAKAELRAGANVTSALYAAGYESSSRFYAQARESLGMQPTAYRKGGEGMAIRYTLAESPLGRLLVAATVRGICAVTFAEDDAALEEELLQEYPHAAIERDDDAMRIVLEAVMAQLESRTAPVPLPLDLPGTAFQRRVWQALQTIPPGERRSYGEVAAMIGRPSAARAVASACAANPTAVLIPCHRVVRGDGQSGGYRWGVERKAALLEAEAQAG